MIKLKRLLGKIKNDDYIDSLPFNEQLDCETYTFLSEMVDLSDVYEITQAGKAWYTFIDENNIEHFQRLLFDGENYDIKFGFIDPQTNKPSYEKPHVINKQSYDYKIFNTQSKILIDILIPYFFSKTENQKLRLPFIDHSRFRLFKNVLNKLNITDEYNIDFQPTKNTIFIKND